MAEIRMPKMGDGMEEGTINSWLKQVGDQIKEGEVIAEIETDKANVEISAYETGVLTEIVVNPGETVPVGTVIAMIGSALSNGSNGASAKGATPVAGNGASPSATGASANGSANGALPVGEEGVTPSTLPEAKVPAPAGANKLEADAIGPSSERVKASPLARRMATEMNFDLARIKGTGPGGRIVERDITAYAKSGAAQTPAPKMPPPPQTIPTASSASVPQPAVVRAQPAAPSALAGTDTKPSNMRKAIANRTVQSKQTVPHFYVTMLVEMDKAQSLLKQLNEGATDSKITVNDLIVKACAIGLGRVPEVNATWTPDGTIRRYAEAHIGIAVGIEEGLIIPVVRDCQDKPLRKISAEAKDLIGKARKGQLQPQDYQGGTFSVSNLGMMGVDEFIAIINPPEAAISRHRRHRPANRSCWKTMKSESVRV